MDDIRNVRLARIVLSCEQGERCTVCAFFPDRTNIITIYTGLLIF